MKHLFLVLIVFVFIQKGITQDSCQPFFPIASGYMWEYEEFDKKDELTGTNSTAVESIRLEGENVVYTLKAVSDGPKKKEKNHYENTFTYTCDHGVLKMSLENMIPNETMEGMKDMEMEINQTEMIIPSQLNVGDKLDNATINMKVSSNGMTIMNMTVTVSNRVVEKKESITTDSGTYDCVVISYTTNTDMGIVKRTGSGREWFSPIAGLVKSETYDKNGALEYKRVLKSFSTGS
ncbi:MAG: hypothetical protein R2780_02085 [Crocinitomicaceae bacterium]